MRPSFGLVGILGIIIALIGIGVIALADPLIAGGLVAILLGVSLLVKDLVTNVLRTMGFV